MAKETPSGYLHNTTKFDSFYCGFIRQLGVLLSGPPTRFPFSATHNHEWLTYGGLISELNMTISEVRDTNRSRAYNDINQSSHQLEIKHRLS